MPTPPASINQSHLSIWICPRYPRQKRIYLQTIGSCHARSFRLAYMHERFWMNTISPEDAIGISASYKSSYVFISFDPAFQSQCPTFLCLLFPRPLRSETFRGILFLPSHCFSSLYSFTSYAATPRPKLPESTNSQDFPSSPHGDSSRSDSISCGPSSRARGMHCSSFASPRQVSFFILNIKIAIHATHL